MILLLGRGPPVVSIYSTIVGQYLRRPVFLECTILNEFDTVYWEKDGKIVTNSPNHRIMFVSKQMGTRRRKQRGSRFLLKLKIKRVTPQDYGEYTCIATNKFGQDIGKSTIVRL